jgi:hypothetical protein
MLSSSNSTLVVLKKLFHPLTQLIVGIYFFPKSIGELTMLNVLVSAAFLAYAAYQFYTMAVMFNTNPAQLVTAQPPARYEPVLANPELYALSYALHDRGVQLPPEMRSYTLRVLAEPVTSQFQPAYDDFKVSLAKRIKY